ncbi:MAG TPA: M13 family metallopeptidase N-terminal domain-containing protein, partial [Vitreimonas sp.]|nr:M13 family metallopeptidase N-terminal domain-containing protein [Vitreimonas sp.]
MHMNRRQALASSAGVAALAVLPAACNRARQGAAIGAWGIDLAARDLTVDPGDDFFSYVNGTWIRDTEIPADRTYYGTFDMLAIKAENDTRAILEKTVANPSGDNGRKIADFYSAYLDTDAINAAGLAPAQADLARIAA